MRIYRGYNQGGHAASPHLVTVEVVGVGGEHLLTHRVRHSPTGLSWGYAGSGPADLARSILWDWLGAEPTPSVYQDLKAEVVAHWPQDGNWVLDDRQLASWLERWKLTHPGEHLSVAAQEEALEREIQLDIDGRRGRG